MNFVAIWLYKHFSYTSVLTLAACLQVFGAWFRSAAVLTGSFWPILAGTTVMSLSAEILWQSQSLIINKWFPVNEYALATSLVLVTSATMLVGFAVTGVVFTHRDNNTIDNFNDMVWYSNIVVSFIFVYFMTTFRDAPDVPPSKVATHEPPK
jgi:hypothetical protein